MPCDPFFFLEVFNPPQFLDLFRTVCFLFCFVVFFFFALDYFDVFKDDFFLRWLHHYEIKTSLPPQSPPSPPISLAAPNLLPPGLFRRLLVYTGRWNPTTNLPHLKKVPGQSYGVLYYTVYCRLHKERIISYFTDFLPVFLRIEAPPTRHSVTSVIFVAK